MSDKKTVEEVVVEEPQGFVPDYKYTAPDNIKAVTVNQLAKLENDLHALRIVCIANGGNLNTRVSEHRTIGEEIAAVKAAISNLEDYFASVL